MGDFGGQEVAGLVAGGLSVQGRGRGHLSPWRRCSALLMGDPPPVWSMPNMLRLAQFPL
jgi:hypothetical protein